MKEWLNKKQGNKQRVDDDLLIFQWIKKMRIRILLSNNNLSNANGLKLIQLYYPTVTLLIPKVLIKVFEEQRKKIL